MKHNRKNKTRNEQMLEFTLNGNIINIEENDNSYTLTYPCLSDQSHCFPFFCVLPPGSFLFEVFGGSGGSPSPSHIGYGGYSAGIVEIKEPTNSFFFVGSEGFTKSDSSGLTLSAFNGGGRGYNAISSTFASSGGGGSDIRLINDSLHNRIIVAGGGGGTGYNNNYYKGGNGGSSEGVKGIDYSSGDQGGQPGTQNSGGLSTFSQPNGVFGYGGQRDTNNGCGGGGGWFGGGSGGTGLAAGGGGSGFVYISPHSMNYLPSSFYLTNASTTYQTTVSGHGQIKITILNLSSHSSFNSKSLCSFESGYNFLIIKIPTTFFFLILFSIFLS